MVTLSKDAYVSPLNDCLEKHLPLISQIVRGKHPVNALPSQAFGELLFYSTQIVLGQLKLLPLESQGSRGIGLFCILQRVPLQVQN